MKLSKKEKEINNKLKTGLSNLSIKYLDGIIIKNIKYDSEYIYPLNKIIKAKFDFVPNYLEITPRQIKYKYIDGIIYKKVKRLNKNNLIKLSKMIKEIYNLFINENNFYAHGDINPMNLVFNKNGNIISIIDWDSLHQTSFKYKDLYYSMWTCINIGNKYFAKKKIKMISLYLKVFDYKIQNYENDGIINNFNKIFELCKKQTKQENRKNKDKIIKWIEESQNFINKYSNKIKKMEQKFRWSK